MHVRRRAAAVIAVTGLTAALLPLAAGSAQADPSGPSFTYVYIPVTGEITAETDKVNSTTPGAPGTGLPGSRTPDSYAYDHDVSEDGNVLLVWGQSRKLTSHFLDTTYALTLTVRDPLNSNAVTTKILTNRVEGSPVLSRDGKWVLWYDSSILWKYDVDAGTTTSSARFPAGATATSAERLVRLAVSPDGTKVAALFEEFSQDGQLVSTRIRATTFAAADPDLAYDKSVKLKLTAVLPSPQTLTWSIDGSSFFYSRSKPDGTFDTVQATLGNPAPAATVVPGWADTYDVTVQGGSYYLFRTVTDANNDPTLAQVGSTATTAAPTDWTPLGPGATAYHPQASTLAPPVMTAPINKAVPSARLATSASVIGTNGLLRYGTWARYLTDVTGQLSASQGLTTRYGKLLKSTDGGVTFTKLATTSGRGPLTSLGGGIIANGSTTALTRNTWLKWCFGQPDMPDAFVQAGCSPVKKIVVQPTIVVRIENNGAQRRVYGKAARSGGSAVLQRRTGSTWTTVATDGVSGNGAFDFRFRTIGFGTFRIVVASDASWGQGVKVFTVS